MKLTTLRAGARRIAAALNSPTMRIVKVSLERAATAGEVILFLTPAAIVVSFAHLLIGPLPTLGGMWATNRLARPPSVRAIAWICGGVYLALQILTLGSHVAQSARASQLIAPTYDAIALLAYALALGILGLTFMLPPIRTMRVWVPRLDGSIESWTREIAKAGLAGGTISIALSSVIAPDAEPGPRALLVVVGAAAGIVLGGLRADRRAAPQASHECRSCGRGGRATRLSERTGDPVGDPSSSCP